MLFNSLAFTLFLPIYSYYIGHCKENRFISGISFWYAQAICFMDGGIIVFYPLLSSVPQLTIALGDILPIKKKKLLGSFY
jgi:hypothetical protein